MRTSKIFFVKVIIYICLNPTLLNLRINNGLRVRFSRVISYSYFIHVSYTISNKPKWLASRFTRHRTIQVSPCTGDYNIQRTNSTYKYINEHGLMRRPKSYSFQVQLCLYCYKTFKGMVV